MPVHERPLALDPAIPALSSPMGATRPSTVSEDEDPHHTTTPSASDPSVHETPSTSPPAQRYTLLDLIHITEEHASTSIAAILGALGLAAIIENPTVLLQHNELTNGFFGLICAGGVVVGVLAIDGVARETGVDVEGAWGMIWRWAKDCVCDERGEEQGADEVAMFDTEGNSVFLREVLSETPKGHVTMEMEGTSLTMSASTFSPLPRTRVMASPPSTPKREFTDTSTSLQPPLQYPMPLHRADHDKNGLSLTQTYTDGHHTSGLLGPSPMPPRRTGPEWQHFTGQGFDRHRKKLEAVSEWSHPGRQNKTLGEVKKELEEVDDEGL